MKEQILQCKKDNPLWGSKRIAHFLKIAVSTVRYHLSDSAKQKAFARTKKFRKRNPLSIKINRYSRPRDNSCESFLISIKDVQNKFGESPTCYLTGDKINLDEPESYSFDHKIPYSQGGASVLNNLGLTTNEANRCKSDLTPEDFISLCKKVLIHNGYDVSKR